jgi:chloramphenicol O-acetyltransferase
MKQEINPQDTNRAQAFELWMKSPMPMVTHTKVTLPISFQFHHVQMDGGHGARFLDELQKTIKVFEYDNNIEYN